MATKAKTKTASAKRPFLTDVQELRDRARQHIERGAVTGGLPGRPRDGASGS